jgi:lipoprotein NlpD
LKINIFNRYFIIIFLLFLLTGCETVDYYPPVSDLSVIEQIPKNGYHRVLPGETLYEIAWRYGLDYRYLAKRNHIHPPYTVHERQVIYLRGKPVIKNANRNPVIASEAKPSGCGKLNKKLDCNVFKNTPRNDNNINNKLFSPNKWVWPVKTPRTMQHFSFLHKGINIPGLRGEPIYAAASGKIVYAGNGLRRYGNLIIIKHNDQYLSAYAHQSMMVVKEGDWVNQGQKIAEMGSTGSDKTMLHFEVRVAGKPVNPLTLLSRHS